MQENIFFFSELLTIYLHYHKIILPPEFIYMRMSICLYIFYTNATYRCLYTHLNTVFLLCLVIISVFIRIAIAAVIAFVSMFILGAVYMSNMP